MAGHIKFTKSDLREILATANEFKSKRKKTQKITQPYREREINVISIQQADADKGSVRLRHQNHLIWTGLECTRDKGTVEEEN